jgi:hypothetical protein
MRTLQVGDRPTGLAQAFAEFGRIDKTIHTLTYIDDETKRRATLIQLNRGEARHSLARVVFHDKRGELRQRYREGQEDQLGALGLVVNMIVLWNTIYMQAALNQLRAEGFTVLDEDVARLSPLVHDHINMLGRYSFALPESVTRGELRPAQKSRRWRSLIGLFRCSPNPKCGTRPSHQITRPRSITEVDTRISRCWCRVRRTTPRRSPSRC